MNIISAKDLTGDARRRWAEERRKVYRGVLRDLRSSEASKAEAKLKIWEARQPGLGEGK